MKQPRRVLITLDAVGGVWRYSVDLARGLSARGIACLLVGFGPRGDAPPDGVDLVWSEQPLDWLAEDEAALDSVAGHLSQLARDWGADLLHLNLPSQAAGMNAAQAIVVASHSCVPSWWQTMRGTQMPQGWAWQHQHNRRGFDRADAVLAPSFSHAALLSRVYGPIERLRVVPNATDTALSEEAKQPFVLAAGRWWDEAKNATTLDRAARASVWPVVMAGPLTGPAGQTIRLDHAQAKGPLLPAELAALMRRAEIFAAPSRYEPFGLAVLEAACGHSALVLADIPTFREFWQEAAIFVDADDADGFAAAFARLAADAPLRRGLGAAAARIAATLRPATQMDAVIAAYASALDRHRMAAPGMAAPGAP